MFETRWCVDYDESVLGTIKTNFPDATVFAESLGTFLANCKLALPGYPTPADGPFLITAGLPCQGFSNANISKTKTEDRNLLFETFVEIVEFFRPPYRAIMAPLVSSLRLTPSTGTILLNIS